MTAAEVLTVALCLGCTTGLFVTMAVNICFPLRGVIKSKPVPSVTSTVPRRPLSDQVIARPLGHPIGAPCGLVICAFCRRN